MQICDSPDCSNLVLDNGTKRSINGHFFCKKCRDAHSPRVLIIQLEHAQPIKDLLLDAAYMKTALGMADYIGVSFVTIYQWIKRYFDYSFQEFKRTYICRKRGEKCYLLNIARSSYSRHDYVLKKIGSRRFCACINALHPDLIMTNAPIKVLQQILRGAPRIAQIADNVYALVPSPVYFDDIRTPVYFDSDDTEPEVEEPAKTKPASKPVANLIPELEVLCPDEKGVMTFSDKVFVTLHKLGGQSDLKLLQGHLRDRTGHPPKANNTRREVYRHPELIELVAGDKQLLRLTDQGTEYVELLMPRLSARNVR